MGDADSDPHSLNRRIGIRRTLLRINHFPIINHVTDFHPD